MITVFYGYQVYGQYENDWRKLRKLIPPTDPVYQEAFVYSRGNNPNADWYRMDGTPVLLEDVPKRLRMLQLVLNL
jgi:hypothetical protein